MVHACHKRGVNHTRMGFLGGTRMYTHTQFCTRSIYTRMCFYTCACLCGNVTSMLASYLPTSLSYNATILVTLFFPYRALAAHQRMEDEIAEKVELTSLIL